MLGLYIAALIFGGGLLALSLFGGDAHGDADGDGHVDADADPDADHEHGHSHAGDATGFLAIFASLRFWSFFLCFGGAAGLILSLLSQPPAAVGAVAGAFGFVCGTIAAFVVKKLSRGQWSSAMSADDWVGRSGTVVLPVSPSRNGKIRLDLDGELKEVLASSSLDDGEIEIGAEVLIVEMDDGVARVTPGKPKRVPVAMKEKA